MTDSHMLAPTCKEGHSRLGAHAVLRAPLPYPTLWLFRRVMRSNLDETDSADYLNRLGAECSG